MQCLYCQGEMKKGYIDQNDLFHPLMWVPFEPRTGIFVSKKNWIKLTSIRKSGRVIAFRCGACKKLIIDEALLEI